MQKKILIDTINQKVFKKKTTRKHLNAGFLESMGWPVNAGAVGPLVVMW